MKSLRTRLLPLLALALLCTAHSTPPAHAAFGQPPLVLLGIRAFADEFKFDGSLRLEAPLLVAESRLAAVVRGKKPVRERALGSMEYWDVRGVDLKNITPVMRRQWFTLYSPSLSYVAPIEAFQVWHDTTCDRYYLIAMFDMPADIQVEEAMLWIGVERPPPLDLPDLDASLEIMEAPPTPPNLVGQYEAFEVALAQYLTPVEPEQPAGSLLQMSVSFGRFAKSRSPGALAIGTWTVDDPFFRHLIQIRDSKGELLATLEPDELEQLGTFVPQVVFVLDVTGDGWDDVVVEGTGMGGELRTMLWTFAPDGRLVVLEEGSWWGCTEGVPTAPMEEVLGDMS